jgi:WD40 repeat protein
MRDPSTPRVFLSYSRQDGLEFARRLEALLEAEGLSLYRDLSDLEGGQDWWRQVEAAIRSVEHVVLVLSPAALRSPYVAREWKLARQEGKRVSPVAGPGALDFSHLPRWMERANRHDVDIPESLARLVQVLKGPAGEKRVPFMADALPEGFVARSEEFGLLKRSLLDAHGEPVAITAALRGAGGYGKTVLANALCHDSDIQDAFSDGILRITLGEKPDDLVARFADLVETLTGERPGFRNIDAAKVALADALDDRRCLLVIDDAWRAQDLAPFLHRGPRNQTTRLVTTRDNRIVPQDVPRIPVDAMKSDEAREMLSRGMPTVSAGALRPRLATLAGRLGEWPLLLGLVNGVLRVRMARGASPSDALGYVERAIEHRGIAHAFPPDDREARRLTAWGTLEVSIEQLGAEERARFADLAVFVEDAEIPTTVAIGLWAQTAALDPLDGEDLLVRLAELSLLAELDLGRGVLRLHDVVRALLREGPVKGRVAELDRLLVAHFRQASHGSLVGLSDPYGLRHLIAHLRGAGEVDAARALLTDPAWLSNKLQRLGIQPLLSDYATLSHRDAALDLISAALTLAASALARNPRELAPQLLARLASGDAADLDAFLTRTQRMLSPPNLVPIRPTFTSPGAELRRFEGHENSVSSVAVLPDGRRALSAGWDNTLRLWDLETGAELRRFEGHQDRVSSVTVLADGRCGLSGAWDNTVRLWDLETGAEVRRFEGHEHAVSSVTVLADARRALSAAYDKTLRLWDLETGAELRRFQGHERAVASVTVLADGRRALSGAWDKTLRLWDLETGAELRRFEGHEGAVPSVTVLPHGRRALSGGWDNTLRLWDLDTGAELRRFEGHEDPVNSVTALVDGRRVLSGAYDKTLRLWDLETGAELRQFEGHEGPVSSVTALADGRRALSGAFDKTLRLWDLETGELRRFERHEREVSSLAVLADGRRALSGAFDKTLRLWDLDTGAVLRRFEGHEDPVSSVTLLADGRRALSGASDKTLRLWDLETGAQLRRFDGHEGAVTSVTVLADGRRALSAASDKTLRLWDLETGAQLRRFEGHEGTVSSVRVLTGGRHALSAASDKTLRLWDLDIGAELRRFEGHEGAVSTVRVLADGRRALSGAWDNTLRLWDLETGAELRRFEGHEREVSSVTVLADGRRALSGASDKTLRLWDLETGAELRRFEGHEGRVSGVTVLTDGRRALSGAYDNTLRLWDLETGAELARLTFDALTRALAWSPKRRRVVVGDGRGRVHVIQLME